jgi:hypothetical protein
LVISVIGGGPPAQADPIRVSGGLVSGTAAAGVQTYKDIPYAKPPVGDLRWRAPQPVAPWSGTRVADHFSPICVQPDPLGGRPAILLPVPVAKAHFNGLARMMFGGLGGFRVLGDGALLNIEQTRPVAVVMDRELSTGIDRDATHAQLTPSHLLDPQRSRRVLHV